MKNYFCYIVKSKGERKIIKIATGISFLLETQKQFFTTNVVPGNVIHPNMMEYRGSQTTNSFILIVFSIFVKWFFVIIFNVF